MDCIIQINVTANWGSTGKIAEDIGKLAMQNGFESWIAYGRGKPKSQSNLIRIGNDYDMKIHGLKTRLFDNHGLVSKNVTKEFIEKIKEIKPDIIHLHNIHGYFLNYPVLFDYLKEWGGPVVWTLHDCWPFTGHCSHYTYNQCYKWQSQCSNCPQLKSYPASFFLDRSSKNFQDKKEAFLGLSNLTIIPVSDWLAKEVKKSFLKDYPVQVIHNGVNLNVFKPIGDLKNHNEKMILGVASVWNDRKGLEEFFKLRELLPEDYKITLVGLTPKQIKSLPNGIVGITRTENVDQLVELYNKASVFVNPTLEDTFPTTNLEALACGTPVITYNTGGSPETVDDKTGLVVDYRDVNQLSEKVKLAVENKSFSSKDCRKRADNFFDKNKAYCSYINLYNSFLK